MRRSLPLMDRERVPVSRIIRKSRAVTMKIVEPASMRDGSLFSEREFKKTDFCEGKRMQSKREEKIECQMCCCCEQDS